MLEKREDNGRMEEKQMKELTVTVSKNSEKKKNFAGCVILQNACHGKKANFIVRKRIKLLKIATRHVAISR